MAQNCNSKVREIPQKKKFQKQERTNKICMICVMNYWALTFSQALSGAVGLPLYMQAILNLIWFLKHTRC